MCAFSEIPRWLQHLQETPGQEDLDGAGTGRDPHSQLGLLSKELPPVETKLGHVTHRHWDMRRALQQRCDAWCSHREPSCPQEHPDGERGHWAAPGAGGPKRTTGSSSAGSRGGAAAILGRRITGEGQGEGS